ncbi:transcriptional regulator [Desulfovibrio mangrovi]|uniref:transcriptional regulator n=1 Tax=Desulfovibrio mangrovi TaxID=2976983 RepID=UPI00224567BC|nr:transcriptional regulator [Desulfovibrio mangrovi]UZP68291.1 transcriptional regulator [Desulfovibrio mangrovi]
MLIKLLIFAVCGWALFKMFTNDSKRKTDKDAAKKAKDIERKVATGEMVKDPVCGAYVSLDQEIRVRNGETIHRFCSYECRDKYLAQLEQGGREIAQEVKEEA